MNSMTLTLSEIALEILRERYLRRDEAGKLVETPEGMLNRVAGAIAEPARSHDLRTDLRRCSRMINRR